MSVNDTIEIEIKNWEKYNARSDVKRSSWFRFEHSLIDDPDFYDFSGDEFKAFIYILSQASRKNSGRIKLNFEHASRASRVSKPSLLSAIKKLKELQILRADDTQNILARDAENTSAHSTNERTNERTNVIKASATESLSPFATLWNKHKGNLAEVRKLNEVLTKKANNRYSDYTEEEWIEIICRIAASDFCNGINERGWKATFSWLLQPETALKVTQGTYDNRKKESKGGLHV